MIKEVINFYLLPALLDHRLTQAAMSRFALFIGCRNGMTNLIFREKNQVKHRHVVASPFIYRGLCDPGDLRFHCLNRW